MCIIYVWNLWFLLLLLHRGDTATVKIGVVAPTPQDGYLLAAAAEAALSKVEDFLSEEKKQETHIMSEQEPAEEFKWEVTVASVEPNEPASMPDQVCAQVASGVSAIVAYGKPDEIELTAEAAARSGVPLLMVAPAALTVPPETLQQWEAVHMYPHSSILMKMCATLCQAKGWLSAILLHDGPVGAQLVQGIADQGAQTEVLARRLPEEDDQDGLRNLLVILKKAEHTKFIVWCDEKCCDRVLAQAQKVGLLSERHAYILLALDLHTMDLEPYSHGDANITGLQLFDHTGEDDIMDRWHEKYISRFKDAINEEEMEKIDQIRNAAPTSLILTYDVVYEAAQRLRNFDVQLDSSEECQPYNYHIYADTLINHLRSGEWDGLAGQRHAGWLRVGELTRGGRLEFIGMWDVNEVKWDRRATTVATLAPGVMTNQTFNILIAIIKPYVMMKDSTERLSDNDRYEGFCIELIEKLAEQLKFNYTFIEHDSNYTKMLLALNQPNMDFAITDLTITAERERQVDFTTPFMNLGISIVYKKPRAPDPKLFAFMLPFSTGVWFCLGVAYVGTSLVLFVVGRLCPDEWQNPYPCVEEPQALENQFTLANALWFNLGAVLLQGSEIAPTAYGSRAVASAWWLFALVITSSYTANLATLLARKSNNEDFTNINELANNDKGITYGAKKDGATYKFFNNSQNPMYKKMFENMEKWKMPDDNDKGMERAKDEKNLFAFFMESTSIEYYVERDCNITQVGGLLDSKGYGIAMKKDSPYRQALNLALLKLQESGELRAMKHKWWKEMHGGGACNDDEGFESEKLKIKNFIGLFAVLGVGCVLGIIISLVDLMLAARKKDRHPEASYWKRLADELRFVFNFQLSEKPVQGPLLPPPSPEPEAAEEVHEEHEQEVEEEPEDNESRMRSMSFQSNAPRRRRSSLHNASVRLARLAHRDSQRSRASRRHNGDV
ncbi:glutamate receptor ionotropic, kainate 2-like [Cydia splendana]|uniref:glutamate receptor ionotropic, kainate 2-like n=1 Tax=Cydia splendana TaxID=1100963 RepID=UPI00213113D4